MSKVEKILKNSFYMGEFDWAGERFQGQHRPMISKQLWNEVQQTFISKSSPSYRVQKKQGALSGFLKCSCGCAVTYDPKDKPSGRHYDYYRCANGKGKHPKLKYISEEQIFNQLEPAVKSISISEQTAKEISNALNQTQIKARAAHQRYIDDMKARFVEMDGAEDRLYDDLKKGVLDEEAYKRQIVRVRSERQRLADVLADAQKDVTGAVLSVAQRILELAQKASDMYLRQSSEKRRQVLERILSNPVLDGLSVQYELKKPFQIVSEMASSSHWGSLYLEIRTYYQRKMAENL